MYTIITYAVSIYNFDNFRSDKTSITVIGVRCLCLVELFFLGKKKKKILLNTNFN